jgi:hypothetical protein
VEDKPRHDRSRLNERIVRYRVRFSLRVTHCGQEHLINLSSDEAHALVDACALLLLAAQSVPGCQLKPDMARVLATVYEQFSGHMV